MLKRYRRLHLTPLKDNRTPAQLDRDRIMYSSAFRRLANVTQVVRDDESQIFHNRLTHSLQVAQVARRSAEFLLNRHRTLAPYISPDVCEAAALAHDMGHPPFGHLAEKALDELAIKHHLLDGFEGNAQSFRIVTKLAAHDVTSEGLDLTSATLNALLKYPWLRGQNPAKLEKWGAYASEEPELRWARSLSAAGSITQSAEAQIMDWADDVTYSVHDVEDFYKAGLIPLDRLTDLQSERDDFYKGVFQRRKGKLPAPEKKLIKIFERLSSLWSGFVPYRGSYLQRQTLKSVSSQLIGDLVRSIDAERNRTECHVLLDKVKTCEVFLLKELTWHYVILNPDLKSQQRGQRLVIE